MDTVVLGVLASLLTFIFTAYVGSVMMKRILRDTLRKTRRIMSEDYEEGEK